jgi:hypothetical protein
VIVATITAMSLGLVVLATSQGFSTIGVVRILEQAAVVVSTIGNKRSSRWSS